MNEEIDFQEIVEEVLNENDWVFTMQREKDETSFICPMGAKNIPKLEVMLIVDAEGDCKIRNYLVRGISEEKFPRVLEIINDLNKKFRYITFSIDEDGDILAAYDFCIFSPDKEVVDRQVGTMMYIASDIMDKCFPKIMKVLWEDDEDF